MGHEVDDLLKPIPLLHLYAFMAWAGTPLPFVSPIHKPVFFVMPPYIKVRIWLSEILTTVRSLKD